MTSDPRATAIDGATLIDGHGGTPLRDAVVVVRGASIVATGRRADVTIPEDADIIDATGKFLIPGIVDTNVHLAPFKRTEELLLYRDRYVDIALETAQLLLRAGVTTVRDSYGFLQPTLAARDLIASGSAPGPRVYVAGNIVGWGGFRSMTFDSRGPSMTSHEPPGLIDATTSYPLEVLQDEMTQGVGEKLVLMEPAELRDAINAYLDKGVDFVKYGGTNHKGTPALIMFSPRCQEALIEEVHRRGKVVDTHATAPEAVRIALLAGLDVVQHPEMLDKPIPQELINLYVERQPICSMNIVAVTGHTWSQYVDWRARIERDTPTPPRPLTGLEQRLRGYWDYRAWWRDNAIRLIDAGCTVSTASDTAALLPPDVIRGTESTESNAPGESTWRSIEGAVELGLTPMQAITCATKHGALASNALAEYGTIDSGKSADLVLLDADPLAQISNIRATAMVMARGRIADLPSLPQTRVYSR